MKFGACEVDHMKKLMSKLQHTETNYSHLNTLSESFIRRAFYGLFGKAPSMPVDTCLGSSVGYV